MGITFTLALCEGASGITFTLALCEGEFKLVRCPLRGRISPLSFGCCAGASSVAFTLALCEGASAGVSLSLLHFVRVH
ncbi:hypothetical protein EDB19DRAFT_1198587 [Suillus lakei]|nr:hypothetical protein EDB19DRAFT_1198587 [Suillus lakei]